MRALLITTVVGAAVALSGSARMATGLSATTAPHRLRHLQLSISLAMKASVVSQCEGSWRIKKAMCGSEPLVGSPSMTESHSRTTPRKTALLTATFGASRSTVREPSGSGPCKG